MNETKEVVGNYFKKLIPVTVYGALITWGVSMVLGAVSGAGLF